MLKSFRALLGSVLRCRQIQGYMGYCAVHGTKLVNARSLGATYVHTYEGCYICTYEGCYICTYEGCYICTYEGCYICTYEGCYIRMYI